MERFRSRLKTRLSSVVRVSKYWTLSGYAFPVVPAKHKHAIWRCSLNDNFCASLIDRTERHILKDVLI